MKPSVILYKALPEDLQKRLEEHFTVTQVKNLSLTPSRSTLMRSQALKACWVQARKWMSHCWRKCRSFVLPLRFL